MQFTKFRIHIAFFTEKKQKQKNKQNIWSNWRFHQIGIFNNCSLSYLKDLM